MADLIEIKVPNIGDFSNVEVIEVPVAVGQTIAKEQTLITVETDKAAMEVPSPVSGVLKKLSVKAGDKVSEGTLIAFIETESVAPAPVSAPQVAEKAEPKVSAEPKEKVEAQSVPTQKLFNLPDLGADGSVTVLEWVVQEGERFKANQSLLTLESDKASMDVPAPFDGTLLKHLVVAGGQTQSFAPVAEVLVEGGCAEKSAPIATQAVQEIPQASAPTPVVSSVSKPAPQVTTNKSVHAGPGVRRLGHFLGVDLSQVNGTGQKGRITTDDLHNFVKARLANPSVGAMASGLAVEPMPEIDFSQWGSIESKPLNRIKKLTAKYLHRNWVTIPHVTHFDEADITELELFRNDNKASAKAMGIGLTPLAFIMKAVVSSLQAFPQFNTSLSANGLDLIYKHYFHLGVAVDTPLGLVVPVVHDVDQKGLFAIAKELGEISQKARDGKLTREMMQGSCFSISSLGGIGGTNFTPIINAPDVAILGVCKASQKPVYDGSAFVPRLMLPLALSYDHRVIDGAEAARFMKHLAEQLQDIRKLLL